MATKEAFEALFPRLRDEIVADLPGKYEMPPDAVEWVTRVLDYNVPGGKMNRGLSVAASYQSLVGERALTEEEALQCGVLGWCIEWLQAFFLVADDVMDHSVTRRGQPCWYRVPGVGLTAVNDSFILETSIYLLLRRHFRGHAAYADLLDTFHEVSWQTELGQLLDITTAEEGNVDFSRFSLARHEQIVKYKTAFYSFVLPVRLAMHLAGRNDPADVAAARDILVRMGVYFQVQDDYLDCYGEPETIGKIGTDIEDNKCSWLVNKALAKASPAQRAVLEANYGKKDAACVAKVKEVFAALELEREYRTYEEESYAEITGLIDDCKTLPSALFTKFVSKIYKRQK